MDLDNAGMIVHVKNYVLHMSATDSSNSLFKLYDF